MNPDNSNFTINTLIKKTLRAMTTLLLVTSCSEQTATAKPLSEGGEPIIPVTSNADDIIGMRVDDFQLVDHEGAAHRLYYYKNAPAVVLMTQGNGCPIVRNAVPALREVRDAYVDQGVKFFLLNSNIQDNQQSIAAEVEEFGFDMQVLVDEYQLVGESLNVTRTAEIFVIDSTSRKVVYHGPVDDRLTYQTQRAQAKHHYLVDALEAVLDGRRVETAQVDAPGCLINFPERTNRSQHANISYHDTIAPLLEKNCVECHQAGGIGPWAMSSYEMVRGFAPMIREVIRTDRMPPWNSDPNVGHFIGDRSLSAAEIKTLVHWIEAGAPRGEGPDPLARTREPITKWPLGQPDLVLNLPPFEVPATGIVEYQRPAIVNPMTEGRWLRASTIKVGSRETVHHVLTGHMKEMPANGKSSERYWGVSVGGYAVGAESSIARENVGAYIPAGGAIGFQLHYTPYGKSVTDRSQIGLYFYKEDELPEFMIRNSVIMDISIDIPPETARHSEVAYLTFPEDALLYYAFPHAHYRGQSSTLSIRYPEGNEQLLLSLPRYDFNWQRAYEFVDPVDVPAGSKLIARYEYDNSKQNVANPDPSLRIHWGEQSHEEMLFTALSYRWKNETSADPRPQNQRLLHSTRLFGMLDDNIDNVLEKHELKGRPGRRFAANFDRLDRNGDGALTLEEYSAMTVSNLGSN